MGNEATARLKINKLLENSGWRLLDDENGSKNVLVESSTSKSNSRKGSIYFTEWMLRLLIFLIVMNFH